MKERNHLDIDVTEEILWKLREAQCFATKIKQKMSGNHNIMFKFLLRCFIALIWHFYSHLSNL